MGVGGNGVGAVKGRGGFIVIVDGWFRPLSCLCKLLSDKSSKYFETQLGQCQELTCQTHAMGVGFKWVSQT